MDTLIRLTSVSCLIDNSGTIGFNEFSGLWKYIEDWKRCFQAFDVDRSGSINESEMGNALRSFGFNVSPKFIHTLIQKFDRYGKIFIKLANIHFKTRSHINLILTATIKKQEKGT